MFCLLNINAYLIWETTSDSYLKLKKKKKMNMEGFVIV